MKNKLIAIFSLSLVMASGVSVSAQNQSWFDTISKIKIGETSRREVEALFGSVSADKIDKFKSNENVHYKTKEGVLDVSYSIGGCTRDVEGYNLKEGAVISFSFGAFTPVKRSKLKLNLTGYERKKEDDTSNWIYLSSSLGSRYVLFNDQALSEVSFGLTNAQRKQYSCVNGRIRAGVIFEVYPEVEAQSISHAVTGICGGKSCVNDSKQTGLLS